MEIPKINMGTGRGNGSCQKVRAEVLALLIAATEAGMDADKAEILNAVRTKFPEVNRSTVQIQVTLVLKTATALAEGVELNKENIGSNYTKTIGEEVKTTFGR